MKFGASPVPGWDILLIAPLTWHHTRYLLEYFTHSLRPPPPSVRKAFQARLLQALNLPPLSAESDPLKPAEEMVLLEQLHGILYRGENPCLISLLS